MRNLILFLVLRFYFYIPVSYFFLLFSYAYHWGLQSEIGNSENNTAVDLRTVKRMNSAARTLLVYFMRMTPGNVCGLPYQWFPCKPKRFCSTIIIMSACRRHNSRVGRPISRWLSLSPYVWLPSPGIRFVNRHWTRAIASISYLRWHDQINVLSSKKFWFWLL